MASIFSCTDNHTEELTFHNVLSENRFAPELLVRFRNGHAYRFVRGRVCGDRDLAKESVWRGVARELGMWHAVLPVNAVTAHSENLKEVNGISLGLPEALIKNQPNVWMTAKKWLDAIPASQVGMQESLRKEFDYLLENLVRKSDPKTSEVRTSYIQELFPVCH